MIETLCDTIAGVRSTPLIQRKSDTCDVASLARTAERQNDRTQMKS